jgi:hypothetical protein
MREEEVMVAIAGMIAGVLAVRIMAQAAIRIVCHWNDVRLKLRLVEAGISAPEIEQIVWAAPPRKKFWKRKKDTATPDKKLEKQYGYAP